ncbi:MAG: Permease of the drug/metabolite transporter (DMT) superfamily [uncultured Chthoniobacterales bacterium]|uniref:Permease of the drug/metabolite transporter (DMT) superfamily n=1 Tax=uncultured Chthoniobacterales bacterium TaxID=1836801 RepID=A0A6J4HNT9_9BACT|nr:MAG: Permease of the drug/metabolite transporter (DMT) superfamily [uncultured Chthoniobacterales bacterium]
MLPPTAVALRKPLDAFASTTMVVLCVCWGLQQVAMKAAAPLMHPTLQIGCRSLLAALLVVGWILARRERFSLGDGTLRAGLLVGVLFGAEFVAVALGVQFTTAGHMTVFLYTAPIFAALGLHCVVEEERLTRRQWLGVAVAFAGIATAFSGSLFAPGGANLLVGDALGILAGMLWGATTVVIRASRLSEAAPSKTLLYQLLGAAILLLPLAWWSGELGRVVPSPGLWWNLAFQTVVVGFASFLIWFWLMRTYLASRMSIFSFLTPLFGVAFGVLFLREQLDAAFVVGSILVLVGITCVNLRK